MVVCILYIQPQSFVYLVVLQAIHLFRAYLYDDLIKWFLSTKAVGEKTGKVLQGQLSELNKKISEVNLQVMPALGAQQEDIRGQPTGNTSSWSIRKISGGQPQGIASSRSSTR